MKNSEISDTINNLIEQIERRALVESAFTLDVRSIALGYAARRCRMLELRGDRSANGEEHDLVQDAIIDTWLGSVRWDPSIPLANHLIGVIRGRTARRLERHRARPHVSICDTLDGDETANELASLGEDPGPEIEYGLRQIVAGALAHIRASAHDDVEVLELLEHYEHGAMRRKHVLAAGMTKDVYDNARRRLDRILASMPAEIRLSLTQYESETADTNAHMWIAYCRGHRTDTNEPLNRTPGGWIGCSTAFIGSA